MATLTTNYQLKKPATTDPVSIEAINDNMDIIDTQMEAKFDKTGGTMGGNLLVNGDITIKNGCNLKFGTRGDGIVRNASTNYIVCLKGNQTSAGLAWIGIGDLKNRMGLTGTTITEAERSAWNSKLDQSGGTMTGALVAQTNTDYATAQMRNVIISTSDPSGGSSGDIWIKYA